MIYSSSPSRNTDGRCLKTKGRKERTSKVSTVTEVTDKELDGVRKDNKTRRERKLPATISFYNNMEKELNDLW